MISSASKRGLGQTCTRVRLCLCLCGGVWLPHSHQLSPPKPLYSYTDLGYYKWDFTPTFRGFDSFYGYYEGAEDYFAHTRNGAYDLHYEEGHNCGANCSIVPNRSGEYSVNIFTEEAVKRIEASADSASPFFVYLAYQSVHSPHQAPQHYIDMYPDLKENAIMAAMLSALDDGVANVTAALNRTNQTGNTVIILSTDNGGTAGSSNYPLRGEKHSVYEGGVIGTAFITGWGTSCVWLAGCLAVWRARALSLSHFLFDNNANPASLF